MQKVTKTKLVTSLKNIYKIRNNIKVIFKKIDFKLV